MARCGLEGWARIVREACTVEVSNRDTTRDARSTAINTDPQCIKTGLHDFCHQEVRLVQPVIPLSALSLQARRTRDVGSSVPSGPRPCSQNSAPLSGRREPDGLRRSPLGLRDGSGEGDVHAVT